MSEEESISEDIKILREWISKQPYLPQNIHDIMLKRFLHTCNHSIEKTKNLIDIFYTIRSQVPEFFSNRDPIQDSIQECFRMTDMIPLPKLTEKKYKLLLYRLRDNDPEKYVYSVAVKTFFIVSDIRMLMEKEFSEGEVPIFDMAGITWRHVTKMPPPLLKKYMIYTQEAHPMKLKEIHLINAPVFFDKILTLLRPFMKSEMINMIHTHLPNSTTLFDYVPKELLPEEYGGSVGRMDDMKEKWWKAVMDNRDYIKDETRWFLNEAKRSKNNDDNKQMFGVNGSFKTLSID